MEMPDVAGLDEEGEQEDEPMQASRFANNQGEQRVVAYIQATT
jgi:hypothetical protein